MTRRNSALKSINNHCSACGTESADIVVKKTYPDEADCKIKFY